MKHLFFKAFPKDDILIFKTKYNLKFMKISKSIFSRLQCFPYIVYVRKEKALFIFKNYKFIEKYYSSSKKIARNR